MDTDTSLQQDVIRSLGVEQTFEVEEATERRILFLADYLVAARASSYVLGISGGVDSTVAGRLVRLACERVGARFIAVRLPYGAQLDDHDAQDALSFIEPHVTEHVDIKPAVDALHAGITPPDGWPDPLHEDLVKGNIKARQRMVVQYAIAGRENGLVIGTDHAAEAVMGFFTKHGDGAADVVPLAGLVKSYVRAIGDHLGAPTHLVTKIPTADLEDDRPGLPDEAAYGVTYAQIDRYLTGGAIEDSAREIIERAYRVTAHKRAPAAAPPPL